MLLDITPFFLLIPKSWKIFAIDIPDDYRRIDFFLAHDLGMQWACPHCAPDAPTLPCRDHIPMRQWRHQNLFEAKCYLHARIPRVVCRQHGVVQIPVPWAGGSAQMTYGMEKHVITELQTSKSTTAAARKLAMSWKTLQQVKERAVARGQKRQQSNCAERIGVDEKAFKKGHKYVTIVSDVESGTVLFVTEGRTTESLQKFYKSLSSEELQAVKSVSMDMWQAYIKATEENVPDAENKIVFDHFHVAQQANVAMVKTRRELQQKIQANADKSLKGAQHMLRYSAKKLPRRYRAPLQELFVNFAVLARAWGLKESLRQLWSYSSRTWCKKFFKSWFWRATHSRIAAFRKLAHMIKWHLRYIMNFCEHKVSNAVAEGLNSKIQAIKHMACGYRNVKNFITDIYFHCGGLALYP